MLDAKDKLDLFQLEVEAWQELLEEELGVKFERPHSIKEQFKYLYGGEKLI